MLETTIDDDISSGFLLIIYRRSALPIFLAIVLTAQCYPVFAQYIPDAGSVSRDFERGGKVLELPRTPAVPVIKDQAVTATSAADGPRFQVNGFKISGVTAFSDAELLALLSDLSGKVVSLADLQQALEQLSQHYRQHGYIVARAFLPAQDIQDGIVAISMLEGTVGEIAIRPSGELRLSRAVIEKTMRKALPAAAVIRAEPIERGLLLMYDLYSIEAQSTLSPGNQVGTSTLTLDVSEKPLLSGSIEADNFGNPYSGKYHLGGTVNVNNPSGIGDRLSLRAAEALDTRNVRLSYQVPVGFSGLKAGVAYSATQYELCCEFAALNANGRARELLANVGYPFVRTRDFNLFGSISLASQRFFNSAAGTPTSDSKLDSTTLALYGNSRDTFGGGGITEFSVSISDGELNLDRLAADHAQDANTAKTQGRYQKSNYALARQQRLGKDLSITGSLSGQIASKNLNSAEKFVLGGHNGVRAYPTGEAAGDEGWLISLALNYQWHPNLSMSGFVDHGEVMVHKNLWPGANAGSPLAKNRYSLSGVGVGLSWQQPGNYLLSGTLAFPIGDNPGRDIGGNDSDGKHSNSRIWLQAVKQF